MRTLVPASRRMRMPPTGAPASWAPAAESGRHLLASWCSSQCCVKSRRILLHQVGLHLNKAANQKSEEFSRETNAVKVGFVAASTTVRKNRVCRYSFGLHHLLMVALPAAPCTSRHSAYMRPSLLLPLFASD